MAFASPQGMYLSLFLLYFTLCWAARELYRKRWLRRPYHRDLAAAGVLGLLTFGFFFRQALDPAVVSPAGGGDLGMLLYPSYHFAARSLKAGVFPLWNPYLYSGFPFAADIQSGLFYPINLAFFLLVPEVTYHTLEFLAALHIFLAGLFMYAMVRLLPLDRAPGCLAALLAAVSYMFCDFFVVHIGNLNLIASAAWLPLAFLLVCRGLEGRRHLPAALGGAVAGVSLLAGHIQPFLYILLALGGYGSYQILRRWQEDASARRRAHNAGALALALAVALAVASVQLLPSYELSQLSLRSTLSYAESTAYSLPPAQILGLAVPGFFGRGPEGYWGPWDRVETGYLGVLPLLMAVVAVVLRREGLVRFFVVLAAAFLLISLGGGSVLHGWLWGFVPGFGNLRAPCRAIFVFSFAAAALAGLGLDALLRPIQPHARDALGSLLRFSSWLWLLTAGVFFPLAVVLLLQHREASADTVQRLLSAANGIALFLVFSAGGLALVAARRHGWASRSTIGALAVALAAVDLIGGGFDIDVGTGLPLRGFEHPEAIAFLQADADYYRVDTVTNVWDVLQPNATLRYGLFDVMGGHNPLLLADYDRYWGSLGSRSTPLYDFLHAKYIVGHKDVRLDWKKWELAFDGDPQVNIYRNTKVMPRAQVVGGARIVAREAMLEEMHRPDFDPRREVMLEAGEAMAPSEPGSARITSYSANSLTIEAEAPAPGYLVLSEVYYPGWRAYLDGRPTEVLRANYAFRAVALPAGRHQVRLSFEPATVRWGMAVSGLTAIGLLAWLGASASGALIRRRRGV